MSEAGDNRMPEGNIRKLSEVIREVKNQQADRDDVVVEMREAQRTRLELLAQELQPVFDDIPDDAANFDLVISSGLQPRLWIDAVSHVVMGRDRRTYRFLRDTRLGRVVLAESTDIKPVAESVSRYIAERLIERQRMMDGGFVPAGGNLVQEVADEKGNRCGVAETAPAALPVVQADGGRGGKGILPGLLLVLLGGGVAIGVMLFALRDRLPELSAYF